MKILIRIDHSTLKRRQLIRETISTHYKRTKGLKDYETLY